MSTLIIAAIIVGSITGVFFFLINFHNKHKRAAMNSLLSHFSHFGTQNNLVFSSQELLKNCILGLDGTRRKVMVVTRQGKLFTSFLINLEEVKNCTVRKIYGTINADSYNSKQVEQYLEKIVLYFDMAEKPAAEIVFYENFVNHVFESQELELKARNWETVLSKMLTPARKIA